MLWIWITERIKDLVVPIIEMPLIPMLISLAILVLMSWQRTEMLKLEMGLRRKYYLEQQAEKQDLENKHFERMEKYKP